jgi:sulfur-oxidizing protein SoxX
MSEGCMSERMKRRMIAALCACIAGAGLAYAQQKTTVDEAKVELAMMAAFPKAGAEWKSRLRGDQTMQTCSGQKDAPSVNLARAITDRERVTLQYPADGQLMGDWRRGEQLAQSGYGLRFTDSPARETGGNCYACHQISQQEVSYGTVGPSLLEYGKLRRFSAAETKTVYEKIYNSQATVACSLMPRFGANGVLTIEQIKDIVALLMSPESPVNH